MNRREFMKLAWALALLGGAFKGVKNVKRPVTSNILNIKDESKVVAIWGRRGLWLDRGLLVDEFAWLEEAYVPRPTKGKGEWTMESTPLPSRYADLQWGKKSEKWREMLKEAESTPGNAYYYEGEGDGQDI